MAAQLNLDFFHRETVVVSAYFRDEAGDPLDITGAEVWWGFAWPSNGALVYSVNSSPGIVKTNAEAGECTLTILANSQANVGAQTYSHECRLTFANGYSTVQFAGRAVINKSIYPTS